MRPFHYALVMTAAFAFAFTVTFSTVTLTLKSSGHKKGVAAVVKPVSRSRITPAKGPLLPPLRPEYRRTLQGILDAAQPPNEPGRIIVKFCAIGRYGNEHFCGWVTTHGVCKAGFIQEQPGNGTVPVVTGTVPGLTAKTCTFHRVFAWLRGSK